jgi:hypothetical protein
MNHEASESARRERELEAVAGAARALVEEIKADLAKLKASVVDLEREAVEEARREEARRTDLSLGVEALKRANKGLAEQVEFLQGEKRRLEAILGGALATMAKFTVTPEEGYVRCGTCLEADIERLGKERDEARRVVALQEVLIVDVNRCLQVLVAQMNDEEGSSDVNWEAALEELEAKWKAKGLLNHEGHEEARRGEG